MTVSLEMQIPQEAYINLVKIHSFPFRLSCIVCHEYLVTALPAAELNTDGERRVVFIPPLLPLAAGVQVLQGKASQTSTKEPRIAGSRGNGRTSKCAACFT